jgi:hypothetical protein
MNTHEHLDAIVAAVRRLDDRELAGLARWALEQAEHWEARAPRWAPFWDAIGHLLGAEHGRRHGVLVALENDLEDRGELVGDSTDLDDEEVALQVDRYLLAQGHEWGLWRSAFDEDGNLFPLRPDDGPAAA